MHPRSDSGQAPISSAGAGFRLKTSGNDTLRHREWRSDRTLMGASLRRRAAARGHRGQAGPEYKRLIDLQAAPCWLGCPWTIVARGRFSVQGFKSRPPGAGGNVKNYPTCSIGCGNLRRRGLRSLAKPVSPLQDRASGEMAEWLKAHAWKACVRETVPWVRIPLSPPYLVET
jgi:hypothetical protein